MSTLNVQKQFFETKRKLGILNLKKTLNKVILMAGAILAITVLITGSIAPVLAEKNLDCVSKMVRGGVVARCFGGQPVAGDTITVKMKNTGSVCNGTLIDVTDFDTPKDRKGSVVIDFEGFCDGIPLAGKFMQIKGKL